LLTCDVDDTLISSGRQVPSVVDYVNGFGGEVVILTARHTRRRAETIRQLRGVSYDRLIMRSGEESEVAYKRIEMERLLRSGKVTLAIDNRDAVRSAFRDLGVRAVSPDTLATLREGCMIEAKGEEKSTPAKPGERIHGSEQNARGSARSGRGVAFTPQVTKALSTKVQQHNDKADHHTTLSALKAVYRRGAGAFSTSHRPGMTRNQWAMGRVNAFLYLLDHGRPRDANYVTDNDLLPASHPRATHREADGLDGLRERFDSSDNKVDDTCASIHQSPEVSAMTDPSDYQSKSAPIEVSEASDGRPLLTQLPELLANIVTMYHLAHGAHWNVKGQDFTQYHALFAEIYGDVFESVDETAELMLKLGYDTPFRITDFMMLRTLQDPSTPMDTPQDLATMVLNANEVVLASCMSAFDQANAENQQGIANFLAERIDMHQKWGWQLRASLGIQGNRMAEADAAVMKTDRGMRFPAEAYAYVPDSSMPSTWKVRMWETPGKGVTVASAARAAMALSASGFRGNQVQLPEGEMSGVRRKVASAWRSVHPEGADMPAHLKEAVEELGEAVGATLSPSMRKRHATIVRTLPNGQKVYKFPIPDKAHARAALAYVHRSDLTASERAKVINKAYKVLGTPVPDQMKESDALTDLTSNVSETEFSEAMSPGTNVKLDKNEMVVTIIQPGANRSGSRFYPRDAIAEAINQGMFDGRKMFVNHASTSEMRDRPERSLTDWVSTIKETWVDPQTGAAHARIKIVQNWFGDFLKQLQENDALEDVGLSIFAQGKVQRKKVDGRLTDVVERFTRALSVDWVTEPGAGGRVNAIWESYQPARAKEQEINVLNTMTATDAVATLREQRPDIIEILEADGRVEELSTRVAELEAEIAERDSKLVEAAEQAAKAEQDALVTEAVAASELPTAAAERVRKAIVEPILAEDHTLDREAAEAKVAELIEAEKAYAEQILSEARPAPAGRGISGLGDREEPTVATATDKVASDIARRMGIKDAPAA
jgi:starvation-inducible DNA-binding protein